MGCRLSKRQMSEADNNDRNNIVHPALDNTHPPNTAARSELSILPSRSNARHPVDEPTFVQRPNMEAHDSVINTTASPETVSTQPPANSDMNNPHQAKELECCICGESTEGTAIHPCNMCRSPYCISCLKSMFLTACKDETLMPARCCQIIQLPVALPYLSPQEVDLYRTKFEEWSTSHRVYCPVPTCSTFIPGRLIPTTISPTPPHSREAIKNERQMPNETVIFGTGIQMEIHTPPLTPPSTDDTPIPQSPLTISCPRCAAQICVSCKQLKHPQRPCSANDLDPELAALLKRWKIKRCPKCRTAVKRMFGCSHIGCRCGAQWCWGCLMPIDRCLGDACSEVGEADADEVDLDAEDEEWARSGLNFGVEPTDSVTDPWNCTGHSWQRMILGREGSIVGGTVECHRCWKEVQAAEPLADCIKLERGELVASQSVNATAESTTSGFYALLIPADAAYHCVYCTLTICSACKTVEASSSR